MQNVHHIKHVQENNFLKEKIVHSVNFHLHVESHSHVNHHSNILICIIIAVVNKNHRFNFFPVSFFQYLNFQK